ncbi:hypothetical protein SAMN05216312_102629 [Cohnella sp. OV330]|uniref:hemerythrin domain-containing protein n=1 Tax=Cohnella sp. OV330 TaxID=1855288 RepID=UPI0008F03436|nr:hemerythrin domain-containing protein [Cohnella sp. OV330]SFA97815.1 hypothetical protein SAMN05216312_102629 [Cohnella sp. OV330]
MNTLDETNKAQLPCEGDDERYAHLSVAVVRARQEHDALEEELADLYAQVCTVRKDEDIVHLNANVRILNERVKHFMREWSAHIAWEKTELFPYAVWYLETEPDLFTLMEQDYGLAERFIGSFLNTLEQSVLPISPEEAKALSSYLLQAYAFLKNRLNEEEEIIDTLEDHSNVYSY